MTPRIALLLALAVPATVSTAVAQFTYDPNIGSNVYLGDDTVASNVALGFDFTFPDGTVVSSIDIDSNGRIRLPGGYSSDPTESLSEFLNDSSSICLLWDNLDPAGPQTDGVYFNTYQLGSRDIAVITWKDVVRRGGTTLFTMQAVLRDDDSITLWWGPNTPAIDGIVGISEGNFVLDPGNTTLVCGPVLETGQASTVYADYDLGSFDLADHAVYFFPDTATGGYFAFTPLSTPLCPQTVPPTQARRVGRGCGGFTSPPLAVDFDANGLGGYTVSTSSNVFDPMIGGPFGIPSGGPFPPPAGNETATADLQFNFTMPGGAVVNSVVVDANGRLMTGGVSDATPSRSEFFNQPGGIIAPLWGSLDFTDPDSFGIVTFATNQIDYATITWDGIVQFNGSRPLTFQVQLFGDAHPTRPNSWTFVYEDIGGLDTRGITATNWFIGCSDGVGPDPGEVDITALSFDSASNPSVFEEFNWFGGDTFDVVPPSLPSLHLSFGNLPVIGSTFPLTMEHIDSNATAAWLLLGFQRSDLDLTSIGAPCTLYPSIAVPGIPMLFTPGSNTASFDLNISGAPGIPLVLQGIVANIGANPLNVELSNAITAIIGN